MFAGNALDDGDKLHVPRSEFVSEIAVDLHSVILICSVNRAQDIRLNFGIAKLFPPADHHRVSSMPAAVEAIGIVKRSRAINGDADQHIIVFEEARPLLGDQGAVGLDSVVNHLCGASILLAQLNEAFKEGESSQGWFAALPEHRDIPIGACRQEVFNVGL